MTSSRLALPLIAMLACCGCGRSCGRDHGGTTSSPPSTTAVLAPTTITTPATTTTATTRPPTDGRYSLQRPNRWAAGEVVARESTTRMSGRITQIAPDGTSSRIPSVEGTVRAAWVERSIDVDDDGRRTRYLVHLDKWARQMKHVRDRTIEGAYVEVNGVGPARHWSLGQHAYEPSNEARNWLDEQFGPRGLSDEQWSQVMLPSESIAVGQSWTPDPVLFSQEAAGSGMEVDPSNAKVTITLKGIEGGFARCLFRGTLPLRRVPNTDLVWSKGGTMHLEGEMVVSLTPGEPRLSMLQRTVTLQGEAIQDGATVQFDIVSDERRTATPGGDFPEPTS